jgi:hypothetical protein
LAGAVSDTCGERLDEILDPAASWASADESSAYEG